MTALQVAQSRIPLTSVRLVLADLVELEGMLPVIDNFEINYQRQHLHTELFDKSYTKP